jgi:hypothetical protein
MERGRWEMRLSNWCRTVLAVTALSFALAHDAGATNYYVADSLATTPIPTGYGFTAGDSAGVWPGKGTDHGTGALVAPFRTIRQANAVVTAGDTVYVYSLSVADTSDLNANKICPVAAGTHKLHISYIGRFHQNDWGQHLPIPAVMDTMSYVNISGFRVKDDITIQHMAGSYSGSYFYPRSTDPKKPTLVVVDSCRAARVNFFGAESCYVTNNIINNTGTAILPKYPTVSWLANDGKIGDRYCGSGNVYYDINPGNCVSCNMHNEFSHNVVTTGDIENAIGKQLNGFYMRGRSQHNNIHNNQFTMVFDGTTSGVYGRNIRYAYDNTFTDNKWTISADHAATSGAWTGVTMRDSSSSNYFAKDTVYAGLSSMHAINGKLVGAGDDLTGAAYDSCLYRFSGVVSVDDTFKNASITNTVIDCLLSPALSFGTNYMENVSLNHNTFHTRSYGPVVVMGEIGNSIEMTVADCIFSADSVSASPLTASVDNGCYISADSTVLHMPDGWNSRYYQADHNLFYSRAGGTATQSKANLAVGGSGLSGGVGAGSCLANVYGHEVSSAFGDPAFTDTTWASFNPRFAQETIADSAVFSGYAGAYAPNAPSDLPDSTYAIFGDIVAGARDATVKSILLTYIFPDSGASVVKWVVRTASDGAGHATLGANIPADSALSQAGFDTFVAGGGDSVFVVSNVELSTPHGHNDYLARSKEAVGTVPWFWIQAQQVDIWGNKSPFTYLKVTPS